MAYIMVAADWAIHPNEFNTFTGAFETDEFHTFLEIKLPSYGKLFRESPTQC
jgi:hypothetical protein